MHKVKCPYCERDFDRDVIESVKVGRRYIHKTCFDARQAEIHPGDNTLDYSQSHKGDLRVCYYCGQNVDIKREEYNMINRRYAHKFCYERNYNPDEEFIPKIYKLLKEQVHVTYDYQQCERQRTQFITKSGYTNEGIYNALKYFYLVLKKSPEKSENRIGIVPYVYEDAKLYYQNLDKKQKVIAKNINEQLKVKPVKIDIQVNEKRKNRYFIDLNDIEVKDDR